MLSGAALGVVAVRVARVAAAMAAVKWATAPPEGAGAAAKAWARNRTPRRRLPCLSSTKRRGCHETRTMAPQP
eukprot:4929078-Prymnesium_polylepis.1